MITSLNSLYAGKYLARTRATKGMKLPLRELSTLSDGMMFLLRSRDLIQLLLGVFTIQLSCYHTISDGNLVGPIKPLTLIIFKLNPCPLMQVDIVRDNPKYKYISIIQLMQTRFSLTETNKLAK